MNRPAIPSSATRSSAEAEPNASVAIRWYDRPGYAGLLGLAVDDGEPHLFRPDGTGHYREVCTLELPAAAQTLRLRGTLTPGKGESRAQGAQSFTLLDLTPLMRILRDAQKPFGQRLKELVGAKVEFERVNGELLPEESHFRCELTTPVSAEELLRAERRLGFRLPSEFASLLLEAGQMLVGNASSLRVDELVNAYDFIETWQRPGRTLAQYIAPGAAALLRASVPLFVERDDGVGALLYLPETVAAWQGAAGYYWVHEGDLNAPTFLENRNGTSQTFTEVMIWLIGEMGMTTYEYAESILALVDRSGSAWVLELQHQDGFDFRLRVPWKG
jgi:hypothetical protein